MDASAQHDHLRHNQLICDFKVKLSGAGSFVLLIRVKYVTVFRVFSWYFLQEDKKKVVDVTSNFRAGALKGPPTPPTPQILPPLGRKGYQSAPFQILHPSAYLPRYAIEVVQSYGAKTEIRTPMHT